MMKMMQKEYVRPYRNSLFSAPVKDGKALGEYFLYFSPGVDSALCHKMISPECEDLVAGRLLSVSKASKDNIQIGNRRKHSRTKEEMSAVVFKIPSIYCHLKQNEGRATCLLRHLRNAIAHGEVYIKKLNNNSSQICFLDYDRDGKPSAQIVTTRAIMQKWKTILVDLEDGCVCAKGTSHANS